MERVDSLIGPSFAQSMAEQNRVAAEEFSTSITTARQNRGTMELVSSGRNVSEATIAGGTRAPARAPKAGVDQFFQKYHHRYIKSGRCVHSSCWGDGPATRAATAGPPPGARARIRAHPARGCATLVCGWATAPRARCGARDGARDSRTRFRGPCSAMPLIHLTLVVSACGLYLEHKRAWALRPCS